MHPDLRVTGARSPEGRYARVGGCGPLAPVPIVPANQRPATFPRFPHPHTSSARAHDRYHKLAQPVKGKVRLRCWVHGLRAANIIEVTKLPAKERDH
jgi:hypothetical protein